MYLRLVQRTATCRVTDHAGLADLIAANRCPALVCWHDQTLLVLCATGFIRREPALQPLGDRLVALVSPDGAGRLFGEALGRLGIRVVWGKAGAFTLAAARAVRAGTAQGRVPFLIADGPAGPAHEVQAGIDRVQALGIRALVPLSVRLAPQIRARGWDRTRIPLPFGRCCIVLGDPVFLDQGEPTGSVMAALAAALARTEAQASGPGGA